jgi:rhodanese-related sulfurtransferase
MLKPIPEIVAQIKQEIQILTAVEALEKSKQLNGITIDVREPGEVSQLAAKGTINIPRGVLEMKISTLYPNEEQAIFIHCASGVRAVFAVEQLQRLGYKNVWAISCKVEDVCSAY